MKYVLTACLTAALSVLAFADDVKLTSGRTLVGIAHESPSRVEVETRYGDIGVPREEVESITPGKTAVHDYKERLEALGGCPTAADLFALAQWAQEQGLIRYVGSLLNRTIELDPDHAEARALLGYVRFGGQWMFRREREAILAARESERKAIARRTVPVRRTTPPVEETPYRLGIPLTPPPREARTSGYDGFSIWSGVNPVDARAIMGVPILP